jgi:excisionase family DNA binding protein
MFESYDDILNIYEASEILKVGTTQIYKILRSGSLKGYKEGKDWKIPKIALEYYIRQKVNLLQP